MGIRPMERREAREVARLRVRMLEELGEMGGDDPRTLVQVTEAYLNRRLGSGYLHGFRTAQGSGKHERPFQGADHEDRELPRLVLEHAGRGEAFGPPPIQPSNTSAVASLNGSLALATSRATVAMGQASA